MSRDPHKRISDILDAVEKCERYLRPLDDDPDLVEMAEDAIERNLQIIGGARRRRDSSPPLAEALRSYRADG